MVSRPTLRPWLVEQDFDREGWAKVSVSGPNQLERILADAGVQTMVRRLAPGPCGTGLRRHHRETAPREFAARKLLGAKFPKAVARCPILPNGASTQEAGRLGIWLLDVWFRGSPA